MPEMQSAIAGAGVPIDILSFDACNMADIAVLYQAALTQAGSPPTSLVKYVVASEEEIEMDGFPYDVDLAPLANDPSLTPQQVAVDMVDGYARYYLARHCFDYVSLGAIDVAKMGAAKADLQAWVARLRLDLPAFKARYDADLAACIYAWDSWQVDLPDLCDKLAADPLITDPTLKALSAAVSADCKGAMLNLWSGSYSAQFKGMTIWWGTGGEWRYYRQRLPAAGRLRRPSGQERRGLVCVPQGVQQSVGLGSGGSARVPARAAGEPRCSWREQRRSDALSAAQPKSPPTTLRRDRYSLTGVAFTDARHGWAVGYNDVSGTAIILRTVDGGARWKTHTDPAWCAYGFAGIKAARRQAFVGRGQRALA